MTIKKLLLGGALVAGLVACGDKSSDQSGAPSAQETATASNLLERVSADTPYLFINTQGMSDELYNHYMQQYAGMLDLAAEMFNEAAQEGTDSEMDAMLAPLGRFYSLLADIGDSDAMRETTGLSPNGLGILYGAGVFPVAVMQAHDSDKAAATIAGLMSDEDGNNDFQDVDVDGVTVSKNVFAEDHLAFYWRVDGSQLVMSVLPVQLEASYLSSIFGDARPDATFSMAEVEQMNSTYGFTGYGSGFIDLVGIYDQLVSTDTPEGASLAALFADDPDNFLSEAACVSEVRGLLSKMPRIYSGVTVLNTEETSMRTVLTLDETVRSGMAGMVGNAPIGSDPRTPLNFGVNLNLAGVRDFVAAQTSNVMQSPYTCSHLEGLNEAATQMNAGVNQPMPPFVGNISGLRMSLASLDLDALEQAGPMGAAQSVQGHMVLYTDQPAMLIGMGQLMLPFLAELDLTPGAEPQLLSPDMIPMDVGPTYVAASDTAIGLAMGEQQQNGLSGFLNADADEQPVMFSFGMDYALYSQFIEFAESMEAAEAADGEADPEDEQFRSMMQQLNQIYADLGYTYGNMYVTDQGIVMDQAMYAKQ